MSEKAIPWKGDTLDRESSSKFLKKYLENKYKDNESSFVLNINSEWGVGKTYFLNNFNIVLSQDDFPVVYIDAWENDFSKNPLLTIISELDKQLKPYFAQSTKAKKIFSSTIKSAKNILISSMPIVLEAAVKKASGFAIEEWKDKIHKSDSDEKNIEEGEISEMISMIVSHAAKAALNEHEEIKSSIASFKKNLSLLVNQLSSLKKTKLPIFIIIDELDRCRPSYSIELLESIKHLFGVNGVYFIIATDTIQLSHSICAVYGDKFNSEKYLKRFFDQEFSLPEPDTKKFSSYLFKEYSLNANGYYFSPLNSDVEGISDYELIFSLFAEYFNLDLRSQIQLCNVIKIIELATEIKVIHIVYLLFLVCLRHESIALFKEFVSGDERLKLSVIDKLEKSKIIKSDLMFDSAIYHSGPNSGYKRTKVHFRELIETYVRFSVLDLIQIAEKEERMDYINRIRNKFRDSLPSSRMMHEPNPQHDLDKYAEAIFFIGQLSN